LRAASTPHRAADVRKSHGEFGWRRLALRGRRGGRARLTAEPGGEIDEWPAVVILAQPIGLAAPLARRPRNGGDVHDRRRAALRRNPQQCVGMLLLTAMRRIGPLQA